VKTDWASWDAWLGRDAAVQQQPLVRAHADWPGLPMMVNGLPGQAEVNRLAMVHPALAVARSGRGRRRYTCGLHTRELYTAQGMFELYGEGFCIDRGLWQGVAGEVVSIQFPPVLVDRLLQAEGRAFVLPTRHELFDDRLTGLALALWQEAETGGQRGALYGQGLSLALLGLLIDTQGAGQRTTAARRCGKLAPAQRERLREHITQHIAGELSVESLASLVGMSPHHFSRVFKASFDVSPYAYVTEARIAGATQLLGSEHQRSLADIAASVGFSSQSHFTEAFRRKLGTTPGRWRAASRPARAACARATRPSAEEA